MCDWPNREDAMTVIERRADGKPSVWCDPCIAPLVRALNTNGLRTAASCCGHGKQPPTVILDDGRWVVLIEREHVDGVLDVCRGETADD